MQLTKENFCTVVGLPAMLNDFSHLFSNDTATVYYDTTFCMGDFYVSCLLYRNVKHNRNYLLLHTVQVKVQSEHSYAVVLLICMCNLHLGCHVMECLLLYRKGP